MSNIIVIGAGMVGSAMAFDLTKNHQVTLTDLSKDALAKAKTKKPDLTTFELDVCDKDLLTSTVQPFDLVICAVPGFLGYSTLETIIKAGRNVIDISFFPENSLDLHELAKEHGVTAIVDCGVAPGIDNIILGYYNERMKLDSFDCIVGGLPKVKKWPFAYKAPFSPIDVIEEYTRPARYVENGKVITREPMTDVEHVEFDKVGTLESFNTDGLRSIIHTMGHIPNMKEKTLRYPGHIDLVMAFKASGFFSTEEININGKNIKPLDFTSKMMIKEWKLGEHEEEFTVMRVTVSGTINGTRKVIEYELYDEYDAKTQTSSMARTTGYTATAAANMFLDGHFSEKGVFPPELIGKYENVYKYIFEYLADRNVIYTRKEKVLQTV